MNKLWNILIWIGGVSAVIIGVFSAGRRSKAKDEKIRRQEEDIAVRDKVIQTKNDKEDIHEESEKTPIDIKREWINDRVSKQNNPKR